MGGKCVDSITEIIFFSTVFYGRVFSMNDKSEKIESLLERAAGQFFARESNRQSMITVTRVRLGNRGRTAQVAVSVFPNEREEQAIDFMRRKRGEFGQFLSDHTKLQYLPRIEFVIDEGEKNRQRIDALSQES